MKHRRQQSLQSEGGQAKAVENDVDRELPSPFCTLEDESPECETAASLDDILGPGVASEINTLVDALGGKQMALFAACIAAGPVAEPFLPHVDGAANLAGLLHDSAVRLRESASLGEGELTWDNTLEDRTYALVDRAREANGALTSVWALVSAEELAALADLMTLWGAIGSELHHTLAIEAEIGKRMMTGLTKRFREHDAALEQALAAASKDTVSLFLGPLAALEAIPEGFHRLW